MKTDDELTIAEAKKLMRPLLKDGTICKCCNQPVKMYYRHLTSSMAYGLILLAQCPSEVKDHYGYLHMENYFKSLMAIPSSVRGDIPKLRFWGLIHPLEGQREDHNPCNGMYRITENGYLFIRNELSVPRIVKLYNNKFFGFDDKNDLISIKDALKNKFDYDKLMNNGKTILV